MQNILCIAISIHLGKIYKQLRQRSPDFYSLLANKTTQIILESIIIIVRIYIQMCFVPIKCLKAIVFIGSICSIIISIALLAMTIYVQVEKKDIISSANKGAVSASLIALYISSIVFLLLGVAGLAGSIKSSKNKQSKGTCLLALYSIGIFVFFVFFLGITIFFFVGPEVIFGNSCKNGAKTTFIDDIYNTSQLAYKSFCFGECGCAVTPGSYLQNLMTNSGKGFNTTGKYLKYSDCPNYQASTQYIQVLAALQKLLGCGGWCAKDTGFEGDVLEPYYYRFSNINDCTSQDCLNNLTNCHDAFYDFMIGKGKLAGLGCLIAMLICFINIVAVCCICCHPSKTGKNSNFYSRMIEMD